jgi:hypothetical protein
VADTTKVGEQTIEAEGDREMAEVEVADEATELEAVVEAAVVEIITRLMIQVKVSQEVIAQKNGKT